MAAIYSALIIPSNTAPANLYAKAFESTEYLKGWRAGETDYSFSFDVCSISDNEPDKIAVSGDLSHITALSEDLEQHFSTLDFECEEVVSVNGDELINSCSYYYGDSRYEITAGSSIGSAGGTGETDYRPGLDFNLIDRRFENSYVSPNRLGGEEGPGAGYRYGACVYEYFLDPVRSVYINKVGTTPLDEYKRQSEEYPCGRLSDIGVEETAAGIWIAEEKAHLPFEENYVEVLSNIPLLHRTNRWWGDSVDRTTQFRLQLYSSRRASSLSGGVSFRAIGGRRARRASSHSLNDTSPRAPEPLPGLLCRFSSGSKFVSHLTHVDKNPDKNSWVRYHSIPISI